jgi:MtaA/CmuA family methyltransferase
MNGRERYLATVRREPVDFPARVPILMQLAAEYIGKNYAQFASEYQVLVAANLACARDFGLDQVSAISDAMRETHGFGGELAFPENGPPFCRHPPLETDRDLNRLRRPDPHRDPRMLDRVNAIRAYHEQAREYSILGWIEGPAAEAADLRGMANFMLDLMDDETYAGQLMDRCVAAGLDFARAQIEAGADTIGIGDAVCSQLSPRLYERLILPREKKMVEAIHLLGASVRLHICGNIKYLLPGIATLGVDVLDVDYMVDLSLVREIVGSKTAIAANLDPVAEVMESTPLRIQQRLQELHDLVGDPFMVAAGCEIPARTPAANLRALCEPLSVKG